MNKKSEFAHETPERVLRALKSIIGPFDEVLASETRWQRVA